MPASSAARSGRWHQRSRRFRPEQGRRRRCPGSRFAKCWLRQGSSLRSVLSPPFVAATDSSCIFDHGDIRHDNTDRGAFRADPLTISRLSAIVSGSASFQCPSAGGDTALMIWRMSGDRHSRGARELDFPIMPYGRRSSLPMAVRRYDPERLSWRMHIWATRGRRSQTCATWKMCSGIR